MQVERDCRQCGRSVIRLVLGYCDRCYRIHAQPRENCVMCGHLRPVHAEGRCNTCHTRVARHGMLGAEIQLRRGDVLCDICRTRPGTAVDHDHTTKRARGRLCKSCNVGLGSFRDDPKLLALAVSYLLTVRETGNAAVCPRIPKAPKLTRIPGRPYFYAWVQSPATGKRKRVSTGETDQQKATVRAERMQTYIPTKEPGEKVA